MFGVRVFPLVLVCTLAGQTGSALAAPARNIDVFVSAPTANAGPMILKIIVSYEDIDITIPAGATALLDRITAAANKACASRKDREFPRISVTQYETCARRAVADAVQRLDAAEVARTFEARK